MAVNIAFNMSWTKTVERERATLAKSRALWRAQSEGALASPTAAKKGSLTSPSAAKEGEHGHRRRRKKEKEKPKEYSAAYCASKASPGYGVAAAVPLPHREGSNSTRPNEMCPITDGSVLPKPEKAPREFPSNYVFAVGTPFGRMFWPNNETHTQPPVAERRTPLPPDPVAMTRLCAGLNPYEVAVEAHRAPRSPLRPRLTPPASLTSNEPQNVMVVH